MNKTFLKMKSQIEKFHGIKSNNIKYIDEKIDTILLDKSNKILDIFTEYYIVPTKVTGNVNGGFLYEFVNELDSSYKLIELCDNGNIVFVSMDKDGNRKTRNFQITELLDIIKIEFPETYQSKQ